MVQRWLLAAVSGVRQGRRQGRRKGGEVKVWQSKVGRDDEVMKENFRPVDAVYKGMEKARVEDHRSLDKYSSEDTGTV